jgi:hypothetical protein
MSHAKRALEAQDEKRRAAMGIAISAGVIRRCEFHDDCLFIGGAEEQSAYKLGNYKFSKNELADVFETRQEMNDAIKAAIQEIALEECYRCSQD